MSSSNLMIKYQGFKLSDLSRNHIQSLFSEIAEETPHSAKINVTFTKKDNLLKGMIHIHSADGSFFSSAVDTNLKNISEKIVQQVRRRIEKWKAKHHERKSLRNLDFDERMSPQI
jgi:ribosome-associated translation inhibitor RaiA